MRFIAHTFSMGCVGLYFVYRPKNRLIFKNINLVPCLCYMLNSCVAFNFNLN